MSEQLNPGDAIDLLETSFGGIRKVLWYIRGSENHAWVAVEDNKGPSFCVDIPAEMPEGKTPMWYFNHAMLFGPEVNGRGNIYASPEGDK